MGGTNPASITQYDPVHRDFHSWILTGTEQSDLEDGSWVTAPYDRGEAGIMSVLEDLWSEETGTPFDDVEVYDAFVAGEPLHDLLNRLQEINDDFFGDLGDFVASDSWIEHYDMVRGKLDEMQSEIDALVEAFKAKVQSDVEARKAEINRSYGSAGSINASSRGMAHALLLRDVNRQVAEYRAQLEHQFENQKMQLLGDIPARLIGLDIDFRDRRSNYLSIYLAATEMMYNAKKLMTQEELQFAIESALWDINLFGFAEQALSSISGASIVPRSPDPKLELVSARAQAAGAIVNLGRAGFDLARALS